MLNISYSREEQETTLVYSADEDKWIGYSCYSPHITRILKILGEENVKAEYIDGRESPLSIRFEMRSNQVSFRQGNKRKLSEEHLGKLRENARKMHEARTNN